VATLKINGVTQDTTDPTGQTFVVRFNRTLTHNEREALPTILSMRFAETEVTGADSVTIRRAHAAFFTEPELRKKLKALIAEAVSLAKQHLSLQHKAEGQASVTRRMAEGPRSPPRRFQASRLRAQCESMKLPVTVDPRYHDAVLFDLDGAVTDTASVHDAAWKTMFDKFLAHRPASAQENYCPFSSDDYRRFVDGKPRYDGVADFLASRGIELPRGEPSDRGDDTVCGLGNRKQELLLQLVADGVPAFEPTVALVRKLRAAGVGTAIYSSSRNCERVLKAAGLADLFSVRVDGVVADELGLPGKPDPAVLYEAARRVGARAERSVVVEDAEAGVAAGRSGGFALVIGVDRTGHGADLLRHGADVVVGDLDEVAVATGDKRMSAIANALQSYGRVIGLVGVRRLMVALDYDGTLSPIVSDPGAARLVDGAAEALKHLAEQCPVAILSGRDLADIRDRVGVPGIWYAGSHGFELVGPDGQYQQNDAAAAAVPVLQRAAAELTEALAHIAGVRVEHKRFAVAVHYRQVAPQRIGEVVASAHRIGQREKLRVTSGRKVVELRPDIDWDKGTTLAWIRDQIDGQGNLLPCTSATTCPTKTHSTRCGSTASGSWSGTPRTATVDRPRSSRWKTPSRCAISSSAARIGLPTRPSPSCPRIL